MSALLEYIREVVGEEHENNIPVLPIVMAYDGKNANYIANKLNLNKIETDGEENLFSSYGKHSDNIDGHNEQNNLEYVLYCPVVFIFDIENIDPEAIKSIYPFSPKAFLEDAIGKDIREVESFDMGTSIDNVVKYIECFFGTNKDYFYGSPKQVDKICLQACVIKNLYDKSLDSKVKAVFIELYDFEKIDQNLKCIILPERLMAYPTFTVLAERPGMEVKTYKTNPSWFVGWHNAEVNNLLEEYLIEMGKMMP